MESEILLVEDDDDLRQLLAFLIRNKGREVIEAANGREALDRIRTEDPPRLVILDLMMPVMDGWTFRQELLKSPGLADVPVILLSGAADVHRSARTLKAVDYLTKPVDLDRLYRLLDDYC